MATDEYALGLKPTGSFFTPSGSVHFRFENGTAGPLAALDVAFDFVFRNNQGRSSTVVAELQYGETRVELFTSTTPVAAGAAPVPWESVPYASTLDLSANPIPSGAVVEIIWTFSDEAGSGSRDGLGVDNLRIALPTCGNGVVDAGEVCDDGNIVTETECPYGEATCTLCNADCSMELELTGGVCGDSTVDAPDEECDEGETPATACAYGTMTCTGCNTECEEVDLTGPYCGDGIVQDAEGEECDPPGETCSATCETIAPGEDGGMPDAGVDGGPIDTDGGIAEDASVPVDGGGPIDAAVGTDGGARVDAGPTEEDSGGCGCTTPGRSGLPSLLVMGLFLGMALRRRR